MFIEFHSRSAFSFLEGASLPEDLISACSRLNMPAMALLDRDGLYGSPRFYLAAERAKLKAHIGAEVSCTSFSPQRHSDFSPQRQPSTPLRAGSGTEKKSEKQGRAGRELAEEALNKTCHSEHSEEPAFPRPAPYSSNLQSEIKNLKSPEPASKQINTSLRGDFRVPLLVASRTGYQNLCQLITRMKLRAKKEEGAVLENELEHHAAGLICLTGGDEGPLATALQKGGPAEAYRCIDRLVGIFGPNNVYVELQRHLHREEEVRNRVAIEIARTFRLPLLATNGVCYATPQERELCDVLTAIRHHRTLMTAGRLLARNSERHLKSSEEMSQLFADLPEAIANTVELSARLEFKLSDLGYEFPRYPVPDGETMMSFLRQRTDEGARWRYGISLSGDRIPQSSFHNKDLQQRARRQIERELHLIEKLDLAGYFLIVWDIVRFCREQNILAQGRGSAANSAVCYSLGITAVDPVGMELLFERFLSEERGEWPDIDIDLPSGDQRERVIQHIYQRYGQRGAAMTANVITYRNRMAAREMGKAMGFDPETLNKISAAVATWEYKDANDALDRRLYDAGMDLNHPRLRKYFELCTAVQDLPRHLGQHSGGMVICQGQLDSVMPLEPASMPGRVVVQWDKEDCADMKIIKVDLLGLGMMAVLEDSLKLIRNDYHEEVDLAHLPPDDSVVYSTLQKADTVGMFQIESRAQMSCLPRLRPERFYDIVVQVAIIRPGPIVGQMVNPFLKRRQGRELVTYPHPSLEPVLKRTLGVPLFQEQLLRIAMISANFTGGEAEELRRAMGFKRSQARMKEIEARLRAGMTRNGLTQEAQEQIILSISSFALYGFPESHAASFALIAYASAWLKCHYLGAFTAALLNNQPMGFYHPATIVKDAQRHGLKILPIDVTKSDWQCTLESSCGADTPVRQLSAVSENQVVGPRSSVLGEKTAISSQLSAVSRSNVLKGPGFSRAAQVPVSTAALAAEEDTKNAVSENRVIGRSPSIVGKPPTSNPPPALSPTKLPMPNVVLVNRFIAGPGFSGAVEDSRLPTAGTAEAEAQTAVSSQPSAVSDKSAIFHSRDVETRLAASDAAQNTRFVSGHGFSRAVEPSRSMATLAAAENAKPAGHEPSISQNSTAIPWEEIGSYTRPRPAPTTPQSSQLHSAAPRHISGPSAKPHATNHRISESTAIRSTDFRQATADPPIPASAAQRRKNEVHGATRGNEQEKDQAPEGRKKNGTENSPELALRLGLNYVRGLREAAAQALVRERSLAPFQSIHDLTRRVPELRKDELTTLAEIGALNSVSSFEFQVSGKPNTLPTYSKPETRNPKLSLKPETRNSKLSFHRRDALWQVEKAIRRSGPLLEEFPEPDTPSPLAPMTHEERLVADFHGTGLTVGPHPMAYRRAEMTALGIHPASTLKSIPNGQRLRIGGCVIARQRPGTAKGFVFLSLEDETGIANAIVTPDLLQSNRVLLISERFLMVEGILQNQDNVISVKAEHVLPLFVTRAETSSHDFH